MATLKIGSSGLQVTQWQQFLGGVDVDGKFGRQTYSATIKWQLVWNHKNPADLLKTDGIVGPKTWERAMKSSTKLGLILAGAVTSIISAISIFKDSEESLRQKVAQAAAGELDNDNPTKYWLDVLGVGIPPKDWCGAFALWALHQAGLALNKKWIVTKGFLLTNPTPLPVVSTPKVGDIAYFDKSQHHAVVRKVNEDNTVDLINGNGFNPEIPNGAKSEVAASRVPFSSVNAFYSIQPFINQKLSA